MRRRTHARYKAASKTPYSWQNFGRSFASHMMIGRKQEYIIRPSATAILTIISPKSLFITGITVPTMPTIEKNLKARNMSVFNGKSKQKRKQRHFHFILSHPTSESHPESNSSQTLEPRPRTHHTTLMKDMTPDRVSIKDDFESNSSTKASIASSCCDVTLSLPEMMAASLSAEEGHTPMKHWVDNLPYRKDCLEKSVPYLLRACLLVLLLEFALKILRPCLCLCRGFWRWPCICGWVSSHVVTRETNE